MNILVFAGTTEGRELTELLAAMGEKPMVSVVTEYGGDVVKALPKSVHVLSGRQRSTDIAILLKNGAFDLVVDATHPYATAESSNIQQASRAVGAEYIRLARHARHWEKCSAVASAERAVQWLAATTGSIWLTTGTRDLAIFSTLPGFADRVFVRIPPSRESLNECAGVGLAASRIIAMQGPFSRELNCAVIRQFSIAILVTKDGGCEGGFLEKASAVEETGIRMLVVGRAVEETGMDMEGVLKFIRIRLGLS